MNPINYRERAMKREDLVHAFSANSYCCLHLDEDAGLPTQIVCTRKLECIPDSQHPKGQLERSSIPDVMTVYDVNKEEYLSFPCDIVLNVLPAGQSPKKETGEFML